MKLIKNINKPASKYLVFTSAGDNSNIHFWLQGDKNFDLLVCYYGNDKNKFVDISDYYIKRKGAKFPNLYYLYQNFRHILDSYEAVFVMDDDLIINASDISKLFTIREKYDLWILQPAFDYRGKISHPVTLTQLFTFMRYTNFIEVTCPLFRKDKLDKFIEIYDPILFGWGVDWWYMETIKEDLVGKVAIVDAISCINPNDDKKGNQREIDLIQSTSKRIETWQKVKEIYKIKSEDSGIYQYSSIYKLPSRKQLKIVINSYLIKIFNKLKLP